MRLSKVLETSLFHICFLFPLKVGLSGSFTRVLVVRFMFGGLSSQPQGAANTNNLVLLAKSCRHPSECWSLGFWVRGVGSLGFRDLGFGVRGVGSL